MHNDSNHDNDDENTDDGTNVDDDDRLGAHVLPHGSAKYDEYLHTLAVWRARAVHAGPALRWGAAGLLVLAVTLTTLYQVQPEEVGVVVRLGKYVRTTEPGLRVKIPFVEQVFKIPVQRQLKEEFGFRTTEAAVRTTFSRRTSVPKR